LSSQFLLLAFHRQIYPFQNKSTHGALITTTRNTAIGCALSEVVLREPHLKPYQQQFISCCPFQLLGAGLSMAVLHVKPLLIILWIISSGSRDEPLLIIQLSAAVQNRDPPLIMGCTINNNLLWELLLIRLFYNRPYSEPLLILTALFIPLYFFFTCSLRNSYSIQRFIVGSLAHNATPALHYCGWTFLPPI
jgi:hypothetical protein